MTRKSKWIKNRKQINAVINHKTFWESFTNEFKNAGLTDANTLPVECKGEEAMSKDILFSIDKLIQVMVDTQIILYVRKGNNITYEHKIMEWLKYNDNSLQRRMHRYCHKRKCGLQTRCIALNIAGKLRLLLHKNSTSYTLPNSQYKSINRHCAFS
eukprot:378833_1